VWLVIIVSSSNLLMTWIWNEQEGFGMSRFLGAAQQEKPAHSNMLQYLLIANAMSRFW
jgi:hypothetical protein